MADLPANIREEFSEWSKRMFPSCKPHNVKPSDVKEGIEDQEYMSFLDKGHGRFVFETSYLPDCVVKFAYQMHRDGGLQQNRTEIRVWDKVSDERESVKNCFVPVVDYDEERELWLIMEKVENREVANEDFNDLKSRLANSGIDVQKAGGDVGYHDGKAKYYDYGDKISF